MKTKRSGINANSFLAKIYNILDTESNGAIIRWVNEGKAFEIVDLSLFMNEILPAHFKHKNFSSFIRQLNMYDFHKVPGNSHVFSHPLFTNGNEEQLLQIRRKNSSNKSEKNPKNEIMVKIIKLRENNEVLENTVEMLENMYDEVTSFNQVLISHLLKCQDREQYLEETLRLSMNYLKEGNKMKKDDS